MERQLWEILQNPHESKLRDRAFLTLHCVAPPSGPQSLLAHSWAKALPHSKVL